MASNDGWIKWFRKADQNEVLKDERFDKYHAFLYLVERANVTPVDIPFGNGMMHLERGQFHTSIKHLAKTWNWSEGKVRRFLGALTGAHMVGISSNTNGSTITIENYSKYQNVRATNSTSDSTSNDTTHGQPTDTPNNVRTIKNNYYSLSDKEKAARTLDEVMTDFMARRK